MFPQSSTFFLSKRQFKKKKIDALRRSFHQKLISPNMSRDTQKHLLDFCMSQIVSVPAGEI